MKKITWKEKVRYWFDNRMARGTTSLVMLLFFITLAVVVIAGILSAMLDGREGTSIFESIWESLMHTLDAGTLAGSTGNSGFVLLMAIVTVCGLFITSTLIGIINTGIENRMVALRKGKSQVLERDHIILLGFNEKTFIILEELIVANENQRDCVVVVMDDVEKEEMEDAIQYRIPNHRTTHIICRSGHVDSFSGLQMCSIETCRSIIINTETDFLTIKTLLASATLLRRSDNHTAYATAVIREVEHLQAALIAGDGRAEVLCFRHTIARIMAHTCHQPGMSSVFTELFNFGGNEIYVETIRDLEGRSMGELNLMFPRATIIGLFREGRQLINPPLATLVEAGDQLILIAEDDGISQPSMDCAPVQSALFANHQAVACVSQHMLVLGCTPMLYDVLVEQDHYLASGSTVTVAAEKDRMCDGFLPEEGALQNLTVKKRTCDIFNRDVLKELLKENPDNVLVLTYSEDSDEDADSKVLLLLLLLRDLSFKMSKNFTITSEMRTVENQELAQVTRVNDFVISSNLTALIMTQGAQTRELNTIFHELLDEQGSELYMRPASRYIQRDTQVDFYTVSAAVAQYNEVFLGYKKAGVEEGDFQIAINPWKNEKMVFTNEDAFVVLAKE